MIVFISGMKVNLKMWSFATVVLLLVFVRSDAVALNKTAYNAMPDLYRLDPYDECLDDAHGFYCIVDIDLTATSPSPLWEYIVNYSSNTLRNFRHDQLHRGVCLTRSCAEFLEPGQDATLPTNRSLALQVLEKCSNASLEKEYGLQGRVRIEYCNHTGQTRSVDDLDIAVAVIILLLFLVNIIGSLYDGCLNEDSKKKGNSWLLAFSIARNWRKLTNPGARFEDGKKHDPRLDRFKALQGMRFMSMVAVIFSHVTLLVAANYVDNPIYIELAPDDPMKQLIYNGTLIMQTYFCIASLLTSYNFMIFIEKKRNFNIWIYPKGVLHRWLRLTPVYAFMLGLMATWPPHFGHGALWDHVVTTEKDFCRSKWWTHLLYINNYYNLDEWCLPQTWYLGADTQLFCYCLAVMMIIWKFPKIAKYLFPILVVVGSLIPSIITYFGKYDPVVIQTPESYRTMYKYERNFQEIYQRAHTNTAGPIMGLWAGYLLYQIQRRNINLGEKLWCRIAVYLAFPAGVAIILTGGIFYQPNYVYDPFTAAIYAGLYKTLFSAMVVCIIIGLSCGLARPYARILEWPLLQVPGKLTYCALFVHPILQRSYVGSINKPFFMTDYSVILFLVASVTLTYIFAVPLCLMVEMPGNTLQKLILEPKRTKTEHPQEQTQISRNITLAMDKDNTRL